VELSPPILHQSGLTAALTWLAARNEEKYLFKVHVRANSDAEPADSDVRALLFNSVQELLLNAVKHSGAREAQLIMRRSKEGWTQIIVEDKGKGFDPTSISAHAGGGFGLFSIQQRLAYLGGRLEVESAPGRGARFVLMIPIGEAAAKEAASAAPAPPSGSAQFHARGRKISVLLVDDHRIMRQGLSSLLQFEEDIEIVGEAENGRQAVELAHQHAPDVIIMDVNMPVMNGIEATRIVTKELPRTKVIALSMHQERDTAEAMRQAGAVAYLTKGGPSEDLIAAIRACRA
jgi:CheY-like chemotaxis protein